MVEVEEDVVTEEGMEVDAEVVVMNSALIA
jgi:hypothetical protein